jgi:hypothetical protein
MTDYNVKFTRINKQSIELSEKEIDRSLDVTLFGRLRLEYGKDLNENFLHILENFACPEDGSNPGNPDLSRSFHQDTFRQFLDNPVEGQIWYNISNNSLYQWQDVDNNWQWVQLTQFGTEIAANWGHILDGETIPKPVSVSGYEFDYEECSWMVSPFNYPDEISNMQCKTDENANVTMTYRVTSESSDSSGVANYLIVGIRGNNNLGEIGDPFENYCSVIECDEILLSYCFDIECETPTPTPTPTVTLTPTVTPTATPTPTPASSASLVIDGVTGSTFSSVLVSSTPLHSTVSNLTPTFTATDYNPDQFEWSFIDGGSTHIVNRSFSNPNSSSTTMSITGSAASPAREISHTIQLVATETSTGVQRTATFTFITGHIVNLGISISGGSSASITGPVGTLQVASTGFSVSLHSDVQNALISQYGSFSYRYEDDGVYATPPGPGRSRFNPPSNNDWNTGSSPFVSSSSSATHMLQREIDTVTRSHGRPKKATIVDSGNNVLTLNGYVISTLNVSTTFVFSPEQ